MSNKKRKQVAGDPAQFKGEFSFVNKDASNIGSKDHNAAVSWHVMNRYERWKKQEQGRKLKASANVPAQAAPSAGPSSLTVRQELLSGYKSRRSALTSRQHEDESVLSSYPPDPWQVENAEQSMLGDSGPSSAQGLLSAVPSAFSTPEEQTDVYTQRPENPGSTPSVSDAQRAGVDMLQFPPLISRILSNTYGSVVPTAWPNETGKPKWIYEVQRTWNDIAAINEDSCYASATLCFFATLMASATNEKDLASQACFFQTQAMSELRQRVTNQSGGYDPYTLKAILRLFSAETTLDNTSTARVHIKMLRNVVSSEGGVISLDSWFRENLLSADCYFALKYETRPLFPASEWSPGPLSQPWKVRLTSARIVGDHAPSVNTIIEHAALRGVMTDLRELFRVERYINTHDVAFDDQLLRWRQLRKFDCVSRLADHQLNVKIYPHLFLRAKLQVAVCSAVSLMVGMVLGSPEPVRLGLKLISDLRVKVMEAREALENDEADDEANDEGGLDLKSVVLWLLHVGMLGEQTHPVPVQAVWFQQAFNDMAGEMYLRTLKEQTNVTKQFLCSPSLLEEVQNQRAYRELEVRKGVYEACGMSWRAPLESIGSSPGDE